MTIDNDEQALTLALALAVTAPDDSRSRRLAEIAETIATRLDHATVERCKQDALDFIEEYEL